MVPDLASTEYQAYVILTKIGTVMCLKYQAHQIGSSIFS